MKFPTNQFVEISVQFLETHAIYANSRQKTFFFWEGGLVSFMAHTKMTLFSAAI
jgi:hypothetical protein